MAVKYYQTVIDTIFDISGSADSYNIYKNNVLLDNIQAGTYVDEAELNSSTYRIAEVNGEVESDIFEQVLPSPASVNQGFTLMRPNTYNTNAGYIPSRVMGHVYTKNTTKVVEKGLYEITGTGYFEDINENPNTEYTPQVDFEMFSGTQWICMSNVHEDELTYDDVSVGIKLEDGLIKSFYCVGNNINYVDTWTESVGAKLSIQFDVKLTGITIKISDDNFETIKYQSAEISNANPAKYLRTGYLWADATIGTLRIWNRHFNKYVLPDLIPDQVISEILHSSTCGAGPRNLQDVQCTLTKNTIILSVYVHNHTGNHPNMDMDSCGYVAIWDRATKAPIAGWIPTWCNPSYPSYMPVIWRGRTENEILSVFNELLAVTPNTALTRIQQSLDGGFSWSEPINPPALVGNSLAVANRPFTNSLGMMIVPQWTTDTLVTPGNTSIWPTYLPAGEDPMDPNAWTTTGTEAIPYPGTLTLEPATPYELPDGSGVIESRNYTAVLGQDNAANRIVYTTTEDWINWTPQQLREDGLYDDQGNPLDVPFRIGTGTIQCYYANGKVRALISTTDGLANADYPLRLIEKEPAVSGDWTVVEVLDAATDVTYGAPDLDGDALGEIAAWVPDGQVGNLKVRYTEGLGSFVDFERIVSPVPTVTEAVDFERIVSPVPTITETVDFERIVEDVPQPTAVRKSYTLSSGITVW